MIEKGMTKEDFLNIEETPNKVKQSEIEKHLNKQILGAAVGDIIGSIYEFNNYRSKEFLLFSPKCFFTDDTVMTFAILKALLDCKGKYKNLEKYATKEMLAFGKKYPDEDYGGRFRDWLNSKKPVPYNSYGNGSAMRVSAVPYFAKSLEEVKELSYLVTKPTHNHPEGVKGAEATAVAIWLALNGKTKEEIKEHIEQNYYILDFDYDDLKQNYYFNETCQETVPQAIYCFLISTDFEDAIRTGISIGGDSDTLCAITGAIAEAYYGVPESISNIALQYFDKNLLKLHEEFKKYMKNAHK